MCVLWTSWRSEILCAHVTSSDLRVAWHLLLSELFAIRIAYHKCSSPYFGDFFPLLRAIWELESFGVLGLFLSSADLEDALA